MASINILLIVAVVTLPLVENAPSNSMRTASTQEELGSRLVFIDRDADDQINSYPQIITHSTLRPAQTIYQEGKSLTKSQNFAKSFQTYPEPISEIKTSQKSVVSEMDDDRRIWGVTVEHKNFEEDESYYNRPLALPKTIVKIPSQAKKTVVTEAKKSVVTEALKVEAALGIPKPSACDMSIIICCNNPSKLKECFKSNGCINATEDMFQHLCSADSIKNIIDDLAKYYKGNKEN